MEILKKCGSILRWAGGIFIILMGLVEFSASIPAAVLFLMSGIFVLPVTCKGIRRLVGYPKGAAAAVPIVLFFCAALAAPVQTTDALPANDDSVADISDEVKAAPIAVSNETPTPTATPTPESTPEIRDMTVHFLDVGQGLSVFVQSDGQNLIYDGGDRETSSFVVAYLKEQGVTTIDYLISSHYDSDHAAGLIGCLNAFDVKNVISSDYVHDSQTYESFVAAVNQEGLTAQHPAVGTEYDFGTGSFTILAPAGIDPDDSNDNSVAIKLENGDDSFIFTGDAESSSEAEMCASGIDLDCDVLVLGHHGSATATSWEFLQATVPEYAIVSCGADNSYGHPDKDTMDKLRDMDIQVYRTDKQGTITCTSDGTDLTWDQEPCNDYSPGDEKDAGTQPAGESVPSAPSAAVTPEPTPAATAAPEPAVISTPAPTQTVEATPGTEEQVWVSETGKKYHNKPDCGNMNPDNARQMTRSEAENLGLGPCKKCF